MGSTTDCGIALLALTTQFKPMIFGPIFLAQTFVNAAVNGSTANQFRKPRSLSLKGFVSGYFAAPSPCSPILKTLSISAAMLFLGFLIFFTHPKSWGPHQARLRTLATPPGLLRLCRSHPLPLLQTCPPWARCRKFILGLAGCPWLIVALLSQWYSVLAAACAGDRASSQWRAPRLQLWWRCRAAT